MMALQQKRSVSPNVYDIQEEEAKTEDIYQTLQTPATVVLRKTSGKKITVPLLIINILLLTAILLVTGIHYNHFRQSGKEVLRDQETNQEMWYLHNDIFYLFLSNDSDCKTAHRFCKERGADLAHVTEKNRDWLQSQSNGKRLLVKRNCLGELRRIYMDSMIRQSMVDYDDHDEPDSELCGATSDLREQVVEWVCERSAQQIWVCMISSDTSAPLQTPAGPHLPAPPCTPRIPITSFLMN